MNKKGGNMSICRRCEQEIDKYTTMFGYCPKCIKDLKKTKNQKVK